MRRLRRCSLLLSVLLAVGSLAAPAAADPPDPIAAAAGWLSTQFVDDTHLPVPGGDHFDSKFGSSYYPNYGENADVLFGLAAAKAGRDKAAVALGYLDAHLADYADPDGSFGGPFDGAVAKVALARQVAGADASDLIALLKADECPAAATTCTPGAPASIFASASASFVILAESRAGGSDAPSPDALDYFLSLQCANGGFSTGTDACGSGAADIDATAYAIMALQALGGHAAELDAAADWLAGERDPGGYWISQSIPNANTTGLAAAALAGTGRDVSASRAWLLDQQVGAGQPGAGALRYGAAFDATTASATSPNVLATAQGLLALADDGSLATLTAAGSDTGVRPLNPVAHVSKSSLAPGQVAMMHAGGFAAGERVITGLAGPGSEGSPVLTVIAAPDGRASVAYRIPLDTPSGTYNIIMTGLSSVTSAGVIVTVTDARTPPTSSGSGSASPTSSSPPLADTGAHTANLAAVALLALFAGGMLVRGARRKGRHAA